jgi:hypothetical protein
VEFTFPSCRFRGSGGSPILIRRMPPCRAQILRGRMELTMSLLITMISGVAGDPLCGLRKS